MSQSVSADSQTDRAAVWVLLLISLIGLILRLYCLNRHGFWLDEVYSANFSSGTIRHVLSNSTGNPPSYYLFLNLWTSLAGKTEVSYRLPSVLFGTTAIFITGLIGSRFYDRATGILAALLMAIQTFPLHYSREARVYTIFLCFSLGSWWSLLRAVVTDRKRPWFAYAVFLTLSCYTHNYWIFNAIAQLLYCLVHHRKRSTLIAWSCAFAATLLLYVPWTIVLEHQAVGLEKSGFWIPRPAAGQLLNDFRTYSGYLIFPLIVWGFVSLAVFGGIQNQRHQKPLSLNGDPLPFWLLGPIAIPFALSFFVTPFYFIRYTLAAVPALYLLIACGVCHIRPRLVRGVVIGVLLISSGISLQRYYTATADSVRGWESQYHLYPIQDWRDFVPKLVDQLQPQEWVAIWPPYYTSAANYYLAKSGNRKQNRFVSIQFPEKLTRHDAQVMATRMKAGHTRFWLLLVNPLPEDRSASLQHLLEYNQGKEVSFATPPSYFASIYLFDGR